MAADFQLGEAGVLVPDGVNDAACAARLLLGEDARLCAAAQPHHAARRAALAVQHLQKRRFARAVRPRDDELVPAVDDIVERVYEDALADVYAEVLHDNKLIIRLDVILEAEVQLPCLGGRGFDDFQLFQLLAAALRHLRRRGAHEVSIDIVL